MSSLRDSYYNIANSGIPLGTIVSGEEYVVTGSGPMMLNVALNGGTGTIEYDTGLGYSAPEDLTEGACLYDLKPCNLKITLTGGAEASAS